MDVLELCEAPYPGSRRQKTLQRSPMEVSPLCYIYHSLQHHRLSSYRDIADEASTALIVGQSFAIPSIWEMAHEGFKCLAALISRMETYY